VPELVRFARIPVLDQTTKKWVYQALREITLQKIVTILLRGSVGMERRRASTESRPSFPEWANTGVTGVVWPTNHVRVREVGYAHTRNATQKMQWPDSPRSTGD